MGSFALDKPRVKICCISSLEEAMMAIKAGASALGLVAEMPSGPGVISDEMIRKIALQSPPGISTFLLTSRTRAKDIIDHQKATAANTIQIVDEVTEGSHAEIRNALPGIKVVQVLHVMDETSIEDAIKLGRSVDAILLDSGNPNKAVKELGGTGRTHNWAISKEIVAKANVPVFLAGGLRHSNVQEAIQTVRPYGLDLCSSVRTDGKLDVVKLKEFFSKI
ncbi:MAG: phosphoribosylanthranilate isomerase [Bacteroidia bacterium]|nr:phosphoribosylanthranilate isomerase [Bacteroidia bacterium]